MTRVPTRLALRIYVVTVIAVVGPAVAVFLLVKLAWSPPRHDSAPGFLRYAASRIAQRCPSADGVREELGALHAEAGIEGTAYGWDGRLLGTTGGAPARPLSLAERDALARTGVLERREASRPGPTHVVPLERERERVGYVVLRLAQPPRGHPPPPLPGAQPFVVMLVALAAAAAILGSSIARPLDRLAQAARALGSGDLSARTGVKRGDELGAVARAFDEMADRMAELLRAQTELLANVAHELRTPLARIRVALDLAEGADAAVARESLREIATDLGELERLVSDILATARMDLAEHTAREGAPPLRRSALVVRDVVQGAVQRLMQAHPGSHVETAIAPDLPAVEGDAVLLRRALDNLLENARKHSPPGSVLEVRALRRGDDAVVQVVDHGEGIAAEDLRRLFTPFFRTDRSRTRHTGGVGLGLTLTRRIVEAHGGSIEAESTPGVGTTMTITLPGTPPVAPVA